MDKERARAEDEAKDGDQRFGVGERKRRLEAKQLGRSGERREASLLYRFEQCL